MDKELWNVEILTPFGNVTVAFNGVPANSEYFKRDVIKFLYEAMGEVFERVNTISQRNYKLTKALMDVAEQHPELTIHINKVLGDAE